MGRDIGGLSKIKTAQKTKMRAKPKVSGSEYLDLYMLNKERERLKQYMTTVTRTKESTEVNLEEVEEEIKELEKALPQKNKETKSERKVEKKAPQKEWKRMTLEY